MENFPTVETSFDQLISGYSEWESTKEISSFLNEITNKKITIKGFLYKTNNEQWILAAEPNLKSCCISSQLKLNSQIIVYGDFPTSTTRAILVQGNLHLAEADSRHFFTLRNATVQSEPTSYSHFFGIMALLALIYLAFHLIFYVVNFKKVKS